MVSKVSIGRRSRTLLATIVVFTSLLTLVSSRQMASAQGYAYPSRPLTIYVPFPGGSAADLEARVLAQGLRNRFHQVVTVINLPGADGALALNDLEAKPPDGYSLLLATGSFPFLLADPRTEYQIGDVAAVARLTGDAQAFYVTESASSTAAERARDDDPP